MNKLQQLPNILTFLRIFLIPLIVVLYFLQPSYSVYPNFSWFNFTLVVMLSIASATDLIDGYLARKWNALSTLGTFLDPVADKLMVIVSLVLLVDFYNIWYITLCSILIIMREVLVSALREWMAENDNRELIKVSQLGKIKTFFQIFSLLFLFYQANFFGINSFYIGLILLILATTLTVISGIQYLNATLIVLKNSSNNA